MLRQSVDLYKWCNYSNDCNETNKGVNLTNKSQSFGTYDDYHNTLNYDIIRLDTWMKYQMNPN